MITFLHAADLHLGLRVTRFEPEHADKIRDARFQALEKILLSAVECRADFLLIAGDFFDDASIDATTARRAFNLLGSAQCPVFVLPGNHDPLLPGSVWDRDPWNGTDTGLITVLRSSEPVSAPGGATIFPCPVFRKTSLDDPTARIPAPEASEKDTAIRIGVAHGSVKDRDTLPPDDHLIAPAAAELHHLDYLALGHWHSTREYRGKDGAVRMAYAGVPEPIGFPRGGDEATGWVPYSSGADGEDFADDGHGNVLLVKIDEPGAPPRVERIEVGILRWLSEPDRAHSEDDLSAIIKKTAERPDPGHTVLRLRLEGVIPASAWVRLDELREVLRGRYLDGEVDLRSLKLEPTEEEVRETVGHGVLKAVFDRLSMELRTAEGSEGQRKSKLAERAMAVLYQVASEARQ